MSTITEFFLKIFFPSKKRIFYREGRKKKSNSRVFLEFVYLFSPQTLPRTTRKHTPHNMPLIDGWDYDNDVNDDDDVDPDVVDTKD